MVSHFGKIIWKLSIPEKCKIFNWLCYNNKLLTYEVLVKKGFSGPSICLLCYNDCKISDNLMIQCKYSKEVWNTLLSNYNVHDLSRDMFDPWHTWRQEHRFIETSKVTDVLFVVILQCPWKERNNGLFCSEALCSCEIARIVAVLLCDQTKNKNGDDLRRLLSQLPISS